MERKPKVALVFLTFNRLEMVKRAVLNNIEKSNYPIEEICFVDNGSTDGTKEWIDQTFPNAKKIFNEENKGIAEGYNQLYSLAGDVDLIARPSSDMCMPQNWLCDMAKWHENIPQTGIVAMIARSNAPFIQRRYLYGKEYVNGYLIQQANALGSIVFKRDLRNIKLHDGGLYGYDDTIWTQKAKDKGFINYYCDGIVEDFPEEEESLYPEYVQWKRNQIKEKEQKQPELLELNKNING